MEGESQRPEDCIALGDCVVRDLPAGLPKGTPVEVEYAYHANGRIAVGARVPSVLAIRSASSCNATPPGTWATSNSGGPDCADGRSRSRPEKGTGTFCAKHPKGRSGKRCLSLFPEPALLERLDTLYRAVGRTAVNLPLPDALLRSQRIAVAAADDLSLAQANLKKAAVARRLPRTPGRRSVSMPCWPRRNRKCNRRRGKPILPAWCSVGIACSPASSRPNPGSSSPKSAACSNDAIRLARQERLARRVILSAAKNLGGSAGAG